MSRTNQGHARQTRPLPNGEPEHDERTTMTRLRTVLPPPSVPAPPALRGRATDIQELLWWHRDEPEVVVECDDDLDDLPTVRP